VDYEPPLGWLGRRLGGRYLEEKLRKMFEFRHEETRRIVESGVNNPAVESNKAVLRGQG